MVILEKMAELEERAEAEEVTVLAITGKRSVWDNIASEDEVQMVVFVEKPGEIMGDGDVAKLEPVEASVTAAGGPDESIAAELDEMTVLAEDMGGEGAAKLEA